jgi:hypothetical protein
MMLSLIQGRGTTDPDLQHTQAGDAVRLKLISEFSYSDSKSGHKEDLARYSCSELSQNVGL